MIAAVARDDLGLARVHARDLEGGFIGFCAGGGEEELFKAGGQDFKELLREPCARGCGVAGHDVGELAGLLGDGLDYFGVFMAEVDAHELRGEVEIALAGSVSEVAALGVDDVHRFPGLLNAPGAVVVGAGEAGDLLGGEALFLGVELGCFGHRLLRV